MIRLAKLGVALSLLFIVLSTIAIFVGRTDHTKAPLQPAGFDMCVGKPCFRGIVSALTPWADATQKLTTYGTVTNSGNLVEVYAGDGTNLFRIVPEPDHKTVAILEMYVQGNPQFPALKELIRLYGVPCGITSSYKSGALKIVTLLYPLMDIEIVTNGKALDLNSNVNVITFVDPSSIAGGQNLCALKMLEKAPVLAWHGFASWDYYNAHGLFQLFG